MPLAADPLLRLPGKQRHPWNDFEALFATEAELAFAALALGASFVCTERASVGRFQVPSEVLLAMPPSDVVQGAALGALLVTSIPFNDATRFTASGLDLGFITYSSSEFKSVPYQ